ncbi:MAG: hypothetical protein Sapg2KO_33560 [Saprospiraceae bacterium]
MSVLIGFIKNIMNQFSIKIRIIFLGFIFFPLFSFGQDLKILVQDAETKTPLPYANVYFKKSGIGISTNRIGVVSLDQSKLLSQDTMVVSYIGYDLQKLPYSKATISTPFEVNLSSSTELLSEVIFEYTKPPKPKKIIRKAIKNTDNNYSTQALLHEALYREITQEDGHYIQLKEAITKTYYTPYPQKKIATNFWEQWSTTVVNLPDSNRYAALESDDTKLDRQIIIAARHSKNWSKYGVETSLMSDPLLLYAFDKIKYQHDFLNPAILNRYEFKHEQAEEINGVPCYVLSFYPKSNLTRFKIDPSRKNRNAIYIGRMYLTKASFALVKFQYQLALDREISFYSKNIPLDYQVEMSYKKHQDFYIVDRIKLLETQSVAQKPNGESILHTTTKALFTLNTEAVSKENSITNLSFEMPRFSPIYYYKKNYHPDAWKHFQLPGSIQLAPKIKADLELQQALEEQFDHITGRRNN